MITLILTDKGKVRSVKFGSQKFKLIKRGTRLFPTGRLVNDGPPIVIRLRAVRHAGKRPGQGGPRCRMIGGALYCPP